MARINNLMSLLSGIAGRRAWIVRVSPTAPVAAAGKLDDIAVRWNCWRLSSESPRQHRHRLQLHLHTLAIAIEDDLRRLDELDRIAFRSTHEETCDD